MIECEVYNFDFSSPPSFHIKEHIFISSCSFLVFQASLTRSNEMENVLTQYGCSIDFY